MLIRGHHNVTPAVLEVMQRTRDLRMREIMTSLVTHLHGFVRDVRLTEAEFREATAVLNEIGALASDTHNEFVLMAGSLGISSLVCLLNNGDGGNTETSTAAPSGPRTAVAASPALTVASESRPQLPPTWAPAATGMTCTSDR